MGDFRYLPLPVVRRAVWASRRERGQPLKFKTRRRVENVPADPWPRRKTEGPQPQGLPYRFECQGWRVSIGMEPRPSQRSEGCAHGLASGFTSRAPLGQNSAYSSAVLRATNLAALRSGMPSMSGSVLSSSQPALAESVNLLPPNKRRFRTVHNRATRALCR